MYIDAINKTLHRYYIYGSRSTRKLDYFHNFLALSLGRRTNLPELQYHYANGKKMEKSTTADLPTPDVGTWSQEKLIHAVYADFTMSNLGQNIGNVINKHNGHLQEAKTNMVGCSIFSVMRLRTPYFKRDRSVAKEQETKLSKSNGIQHLLNRIHADKNINLSIVDFDEDVELPEYTWGMAPGTSGMFVSGTNMQQMDAEYASRVADYMGVSWNTFRSWFMDHDISEFVRLVEAKMEQSIPRLHMYNQLDAEFGADLCAKFKSMNFDAVMSRAAEQIRAKFAPPVIHEDDFWVA